MDFKELNILSYVFQLFKEWDSLYGLKDKTVFLSAYQSSLDIPKAILKMGAAKVIFYNPEDINSDDEKIICFNIKKEEINLLEDKSVDLILGYEMLEHINNLDNFFYHVKRILKDNGKVEIQGTPMYTCHFGHHLWIKDKFIFYEKSNPFEPWEHLMYNTKEEVEEALEKKHISKEDSRLISEWIYNKNEVSRHTPSEIISAAIGQNAEDISSSKTDFFASSIEHFQINGWKYSAKRHFEKISKNEFYNLAKEKYTEADLKTAKLTIKMSREDSNNEETTFVKKEFPVLDSSISDIITPFNKLHDCKNLNVLNLSYYQNDKISQTFSALGANIVYGVSKNATKFDENNPDVIIYQTAFENFENPQNIKFDIVFGLDTINNIEDIKSFTSKLKEVVKYNTAFYLSGYKPYTSAEGHLICYDKYNTFQGCNPLKFWQHLTCKNENELYNALLENNVNENISKNICEIQKSKNAATKLSPTELTEMFQSVTNLHLKRIYKYYPKNNFYNEALKEYSEEDLNTDRIIITSDKPEYQQFENINIDYYFKESLFDINAKYKFLNKKILNITPYVNGILTEAIVALGAKEVVSLAPYYSGFELNSEKNVRCVNQDFEDLSNIDENFDIIYGLDVLEHVKDLRKFFANVIRLIDKNGVICLTGSPLWPSDNGHNFTLPLDCDTLKTGSGYKKIDYWEHLAYNSQTELKNKMINKGFSEKDAETVSDFIFNSNSINRKSFAEILNILNEFENITYGSRKILDFAEENEFYKIASEKYTHEELRTKELKLFVRKKQ
ncbi:MAG: methyltransferase domain-containing protein [Candidatus Gastranaerophilaceae bacterium]